MSALPREPDWLMRDHIACGSLVETYLHISRVRPLTDAERAECKALLAWSKRRAAVVQAITTRVVTDAAAIEAALAELGRAPIPAVRPQRPALNGGAL